MSIESCTDLQELPESCLANVLSLTSVKDACRLSLVNSTFRSAAESDAVWERFLPPDYRHIISRSIDGADSLLAKFRTKKELYLHLCHNPILIDGGTKSFSLEKETGKKCFMLASRDLFILSSDTSHWQWISFFKSRFPVVAARRHAGCRFEIRGKINTALLSSGTKYAAYLVFTLRARTRPSEFHLAHASIQISGKEAKVDLNPDEEQGQRCQCQTVSIPRFFVHQISHVLTRTSSPVRYIKYPKFRDDAWMEVELGEFFIEIEGKQDQDVEIISKECGWERQHWRTGVLLIIEGIDIRPRAD